MIAESIKKIKIELDDIDKQRKLKMRGEPDKFKHIKTLFDTLLMEKGEHPLAINLYRAMSHSKPQYDFTPEQTRHINERAEKTFTQEIGQEEVYEWWINEGEYYYKIIDKFTEEEKIHIKKNAPISGMHDYELYKWWIDEGYYYCPKIEKITKEKSKYILSKAPSREMTDYEVYRWWVEEGEYYYDKIDKFEKEYIAYIKKRNPFLEEVSDYQLFKWWIDEGEYFNQEKIKRKLSIRELIECAIAENIHTKISKHPYISDDILYPALPTILKAPKPKEEGKKEEGKKEEGKKEEGTKPKETTPIMVQLKLKDGNIKMFKYEEALKLVINDDAKEIKQPSIINLDRVIIKIKSGSTIYNCDVESAKKYIIDHEGREIDDLGKIKDDANTIIDLDKLYKKHDVQVKIIEDGWEDTVPIEVAKRRIKANPTKVKEVVLPGKMPKINVAKILAEPSLPEPLPEPLPEHIKKQLDLVRNINKMKRDRLLKEYEERPIYLDFMTFDEWNNKGKYMNEFEAEDEYKEWQRDIKASMSYGMSESFKRYLRTVPANQLKEEIQKWHLREYKKSQLPYNPDNFEDGDNEEDEEELIAYGKSKRGNKFEDSYGGSEDIYYKKYLKYKAKYLKLKNQF